MPNTYLMKLAESRSSVRFLSNNKERDTFTYKNNVQSNSTYLKQSDVASQPKSITTVHRSAVKSAESSHLIKNITFLLNNYDKTNTRSNTASFTTGLSKFLKPRKKEVISIIAKYDNAKTDMIAETQNAW